MVIKRSIPRKPIITRKQYVRKIVRARAVHRPTARISQSRKEAIKKALRKKLRRRVMIGARKKIIGFRGLKNPTPAINKMKDRKALTDLNATKSSIRTKIIKRPTTIKKHRFVYSKGKMLKKPTRKGILKTKVSRFRKSFKPKYKGVGTKGIGTQGWSAYMKKFSQRKAKKIKVLGRGPIPPTAM